MLGLFILGVLIGVGFLIYLGYKLPRKYFKSRVAGIIGALLVFCIFFGDHIYQEYEYKKICATETINKVYDKKAYQRFEKNWKENKTVKLTGKELSVFMQENSINNYDDYAVIYDPKSNLIEFSMKKNERNIISHIIIKDVRNNLIIKEYKDYGGHGGWLCKKLDLTRGTCVFKSCSVNRLGTFKNK